jgi:hypothetical protein
VTKTLKFGEKTWVRQMKGITIGLAEHDPELVEASSFICDIVEGILQSRITECCARPTGDLDTFIASTFGLIEYVMIFLNQQCSMC